MRLHKILLSLIFVLVAGFSTHTTAQRSVFSELNYGTVEDVLRILPQLLRREGGVNTYEGSGDYGPLHYAAVSNPHPEVITLLIESGATVDALVDGINGTALHLALQSNPNEQVAIRLLEHGASLDETLRHYRMEPRDAIELAAQYRRVEFLRTVAAHPDLYGGYAEQAAGILEDFAREEERAAHEEAQRAMEEERLERYRAQLLIDAESNPQRIFQLIGEGKIDDLEFLLSEKALNLAIQDAYGQTPLMYAVDSDILESVRMLVHAGADVDAASLAGWTALMYAARASKSGETVKVLLEAGADTDAKNQDGQAAIDLANEVALQVLSAFEQAQLAAAEEERAQERRRQEQEDRARAAAAGRLDRQARFAALAGEPIDRLMGRDSPGYPLRTGSVPGWYTGAFVGNGPPYSELKIFVANMDTGEYCSWVYSIGGDYMPHIPLPTIGYPSALLGAPPGDQFPAFALQTAFVYTEYHFIVNLATKQCLVKVH